MLAASQDVPGKHPPHPSLPLTQEKLAELVGLNPRTIQKIEAGDINVLVTTAAGIEKALGCGWDKMMGG